MQAQDSALFEFVAFYLCLSSSATSSSSSSYVPFWLLASPILGAVLAVRNLQSPIRRTVLACRPLLPRFLLPTTRAFRASTQHSYFASAHRRDLSRRRSKDNVFGIVYALRFHIVFFSYILFERTQRSFLSYESLSDLYIN